MSRSLFPPVFVVSGTGMRSSLHSHHAWQLMVGLDGPVRFQNAAGDAPFSADAVLTRPDVPHAADSDGHEVVVVFVHPESEVGARLGARRGSGNEALAGAVAQRVRESFRSARTRAERMQGGMRALAALGVDGARPVVAHPGVRRVLRHLRRDGPAGDASLASLAERSGLSPSRLMHVFTAEVGIPLRPYLRWLKLERAARQLAAGAAPADAAQAAGFSDAAHMGRSFRAMLGITPAALRRSQSVQARRLPRAAESVLRAEELAWSPLPPPSGPAAP